MAAVDIDRDSLEARAVRPLRRSGNSIVASIPPTLLQAAGFDEDDDVLIVGDIETGEITIKRHDPD